MGWFKITRSTLCSVGLPTWGLNTELPGVLAVQSLPTFELHGVRADNASDGLTGEMPIQNIEADVPSGCTHCDVAAIDVGPQRQARAASGSFKLPPHIKAAPVVLKEVGSVGPSLLSR